MEFSNVLMGIAVIAVVLAGINVVMVSTELSPTGRVPTGTGTTEVAILSAVHIVFQVANLDWGSGSVATDPATLDSVTAPYYNANWVPFAGDAPQDAGPDGFIMSGGLVLENTGNVDADLNMRSTADANAFICNGIASCTGTGLQQFNWRFSDVAAGACGDKDVDLPLGTDPRWSSFEAVSTAASPGPKICDQFLFDDAVTPNIDQVEIDFQLVIPVLAQPGSRTASIEATATVSV